MENISVSKLTYSESEYRLKLNGNHLVGVSSSGFFSRRKRKSAKPVEDSLRCYFEQAYSESLELNKADKAQVEYINSRMNDLIRKYAIEDLFDISDKDYREYIEKRIKAKALARIFRVKRFQDKASLSMWNYFVTLTYDSTKFESEDAFRKALLTCLSHLSCDYGWRYMGCFERGEKTERLHFHGIFYIPNGKMKGIMRKSRYYSLRDHRMHNSTINSFFAERFGRNDFEFIGKNKSSITGVSNYILKYIRKSEDKVIYSRGIISSFETVISPEEIVMSYNCTYCVKHMFYDDLLSNTILERYRIDCS